MPRITLAHWHAGRAPGEDIDVDDEELKQLRRDGRVAAVHDEQPEPEAAPEPEPVPAAAPEPGPAEAEAEAEHQVAAAEPEPVQEEAAPPSRRKR
ncbi:hypothetical protein [Streptomyces sp. NPDC006285]|uniref:hypothetical protein n=1 Tax=Streptomyces sp. NPDC006285 TaxID=3364742 RepID=UPI0036B08C82